MNIAIEQRKQRLVDRYGSWTAHNIQLAAGSYTIGDRVVGDEVRLRRVMQIIADLARKPMAELRVLDLACLEGLFAVELALRGADVLAIEGREANAEKTRFAKEALSVPRLQIEVDDVRNLRVEKHGTFDVVLCLGLLYHLDAPDLLPFLERIAEVCRGFAIIDTHISLKPEVAIRDQRGTFHGRWFVEHRSSAGSAQKTKVLWASLDNPRSFWFTKPSLLNALSRVGFTSVYECHTPRVSLKTGDRVTLVAVKGARQSILSSRAINELAEDDWPERVLTRAHAGRASRLYRIISAIGRRFPPATRERVKAILARRG